MSLPKSRLRALMGSVTPQLIEEEARLERINTHAGERLLRIVGHAWRVRGLFEKRDDAVVLVNRHHAEAGGLGARHLNAADRHIGSRVNMLLEHQLVIHFIDMVARQDDHILGVVAPDDVDVLIHRIRGSGIPHAFVEALARGKNVEALVALGPEEIPTPLQMPDQAVSLVLGRHRDLANSRIQRIRNGKIDDARIAAEKHGGLGALFGELMEPGPAPPGQDIGHRRPGDRS